MASRDYAQQRRGGGSQARSRGGNGGKKSGGGLPGWVWLAAGLSVGLAVAAFIYIQRPAGSLPGAARDATESVEEAPAPKAAKNKRGKPEPIPLPPKEKERFTFYEILRNQEVIIPREATKSAQPPTVADTGSGSYLIQTASFRSQPEAERHKANLALLGVESRIESVTIDNKDTFYRVRVGPINDWNKVQTIISTLDSNGIQGMVVRLR
jgi:cell division protein FtsN